MAFPRPSGPKGIPYFGTLLRFRRDPLRYLVEMREEYGDIVYWKGGREHLYMLNDPADIHRIFVTDNKNFTKSRGLDRTKMMLGKGLLTSEGGFHKRQRRLIMPAFHRKRIAAYGDIMSQETAQHLEAWQDGQEIDMDHEMMALTLKIVGQTLFDTDVSAEATAVGHAIDTLLQGWWLGMLLPLPDSIIHLPIPRFVQLRKSIQALDALIFGLIEERRQSGKDHGDLLSMLLQAEDEEDGGHMDNQQIRDEAMTLFLAGHETTANALTWTWYLLADHPEVVTKLQQEVDSVLDGRLPTMADMPSLPYTEMVFREGMRRYPPAWTIGRRAIEGFELKGYSIPAGSTIMISPYAVHHDPRYYPAPFAFRPERWEAEKKAALPKYAYIPFGGGARRCIGEAFAWMEGVLLLATMAQSWTMEPVPSHKVETMPLITLRPKNGIKLMPRRR